MDVFLCQNILLIVCGVCSCLLCNFLIDVFIVLWLNFQLLFVYSLIKQMINKCTMPICTHTCTHTHTHACSNIHLLPYPLTHSLTHAHTHNMYIRHSGLFFVMSLHPCMSSYQYPLEHCHHPPAALKHLVVMSII